MAKKKKLNRLEKLLLTAMALALILGITVGVTMAFVLTETESLENTFVPARVQVSLNQEFNANTGMLQSVTVVNDHSNIPVYIRVAVVTNWRNTDGNVCGGAHDAALPEIPALAGDSDWILHTDGFYYYKHPVTVNGTTANLLSTGITLPVAGDGCSAQMFFLASAIQAQGSNSNGVPAYKDAWENAPDLQ